MEVEIILFGGIKAGEFDGMHVVDKGGVQWMDVGGGLLIVIRLLDLFRAKLQCKKGENGQRIETDQLEQPLFFLLGQGRLKLGIMVKMRMQK